MARFTPRRLVAIGLLVLALSVAGFAVVEAMRPPTRAQDVVMSRLAQLHVAGEMYAEERTRRLHDLDIGICGWFLQTPYYRNYRLLALSGALLGVLLVGAGATRAARRRHLVPPPRS
jgi:hypothetical protein